MLFHRTPTITTQPAATIVWPASLACAGLGALAAEAAIVGARVASADACETVRWTTRTVRGTGATHTKMTTLRLLRALGASLEPNDMAAEQPQDPHPVHSNVGIGTKYGFDFCGGNCPSHQRGAGPMG